MNRVAATHADWLGLLDTHGQFLTLPVLREALPGGLDRVRPEHRAEVRARLDALTDEPADRTAWLEYLLRDLLEWGPRLHSDVAIPQDLTSVVAEHHTVLRPDYALMGPATGRPGEQARAMVIRFPVGTDLTGRLPGEKWVASPIDRVARLCRATGVPVGLATNTDQLALVWAPTNAPLGYGTWPTTLLGEEPVLLDALVTILGAKRFFAVRAETQLEAMLTRAASAEHDVTAQLGRQVRQAVEMLVAALSRANSDRGGQLLAGVDPHTVYEGAVTVMMRLVFLLYAEERHLLPLGDPLYDANYAASTLREQLREEADAVGEEPLELRSTAWHRLLATFRAVHAGVTHEQLRLPAYGGSLFDPDRFPFLEGRTADQPWRTHAAAPVPVDDATVLAALTALQVLEIREAGVTEPRRLSFRTLDVEQIGHVYEGLLDHGSKRVDEVAVGLIGKAGQEAEIALADIEAKASTGRAALVDYLAEQTRKSTASVEKALDTALDADLIRLVHTACENRSDVVTRVLPYARLLRQDLRGLPMVFLPGSVYVTETSLRRDSGTEYTTKELADEIVHYALEPLVYDGPAEGKPAEEWTLKPSSAILKIRACDPAVGSGAIIVAACRYLADRLVEAWVTEGRTTAADALAEEADEITIEARRAVADQCLYGVDRDPMAVEMAKLSIWLTTMARERPFSFLDHAFRSGDSLIGLTRLKQIEALHIDPTRAAGQLRFADELEPRLKAAIAKRQELESIEIRTVRDAEEKARLNDEANSALAVVQLVADLISGAALATATAKPDVLDVRLQGLHGRVARLLDPAVAQDDRAALAEELRQLADSWLNQGRPETAPLRSPLHWAIAYPEVFADGGFSAMVANPPFVGGKRISGPMGSDFREFLVRHVAGGRKGNADLVAYFFLLAANLLRPGGTFGFLATNTISQGDTREVGLDQLAERGTIYRADKSRLWPGSAAVRVSPTWFYRGTWSGELQLNGKVVPGIRTTLDPAGRVEGKPYRLAANSGGCFIGSALNTDRFILDAKEGSALAGDGSNRDVVMPYVNGDDLVNSPNHQGVRWAINFRDWPESEARKYPEAYQVLTERVKPEVEAKGRSYAGWTDRWWQFWRPRRELYDTLGSRDRALAITRVSKSVMPVWAGTVDAVFSDAVAVWPSADDHLCGVLSSAFHYWWTITQASTLESRIRYTPTDCFETFPLPPSTTTVAESARPLVRHRADLMLSAGEGITKTYNRVHDSAVADAGIVELRRLHVELDFAVRDAYGWSDLALDHGFHDTDQGVRYTVSTEARAELLTRLLELNHERHAAEQASGITAPGKKTGRHQKKAAAAPPDDGTLMLPFN